jgi:hypothetical protein
MRVTRRDNREIPGKLEKYRKERGVSGVKGINTSEGILKNSTPKGESGKLTRATPYSLFR